MHKMPGPKFESVKYPIVSNLLFGYVRSIVVQIFASVKHVDPSVTFY